ncbi:MAG: hypothetical protein HYX76_10115 [Acidobacteria bacterium]|nr:hypothetical protein [Acidobacteriota bacterium]
MPTDNRGCAARAITIERIHLADDRVTVVLTPFAGTVVLTHQALGELVGLVARETWQAVRVPHAPPGADRPRGPASVRPRASSEGFLERGG